MKTRMMQRIAVLVTGSALALSLPVASSVANQGGMPNDGNGHSRACDNWSKNKGNGPKFNPHRNTKNAGKGQRCGWLNLD